MNSLLKLVAPTLLALSSGITFAQDSGSFPGIEALMTADEYEAAGIDKLSADERRALNQWLIRYTAEDSQVLLNTDEEVQEAVKEQSVTTTLDDSFKGWSGETLFRLENGQIWQQRRRGNYKYVGPANPEVEITKNFMGFYRMELLANGKSVQVKRVK